MKLGYLFEIKIADEVRADDQKGFFCFSGGKLDRAGGAEILVGLKVLNIDAKFFAIAEMLLYDFGLMIKKHHDIPEPVPG